VFPPLLRCGVHPSGLAETHIPAVRDYVEANIVGSPFTRVWLYATDAKAVLYESARTPNGLSGRQSNMSLQPTSVAAEKW
jgi:hypothetical protein